MIMPLTSNHGTRFHTIDGKKFVNAIRLERGTYRRSPREQDLHIGLYALAQVFISYPSERSMIVSKELGNKFC
jgi:hypothetical protein